jgi:hypothetical protein
MKLTDYQRDLIVRKLYDKANLKDERGTHMLCDFSVPAMDFLNVSMGGTEMLSRIEGFVDFLDELLGDE